MPKINVYLPNDLAQAVKDVGIPVSAVCQHALSRALERTLAVRKATSSDLSTAELAASLDSDPLVAVISAATAQARAQGVRVVGTRHLLGALLAQRDSAAAALLRDLDVHQDDLERELARQPVEEPGLAGTAHSEQFSAPASQAVASAAAEATDDGDIRAEHLMLGLIAEPEGAVGKALRALGVKLSAARHAANPAHGDDRAARSKAAVESAMNELAGALYTASQAQFEALAARLDRLERLAGETTYPVGEADRRGVTA
jgi:ATP-dependent Clp protease ATP-binding subunit ClpC